MTINEDYMIALLSTAIAWVTANAGTIIAFAVKYIKEKAKEIAQEKEYQEVIENLKAEYEAKTQQLYAQVDEKLDIVSTKLLENQIVLQATENAKIENEQLELTNAVSEIKKNLSIDDIIA